MDTTQTTTHISLCAGYGGIDLGLRGAIPNLRTVAFSEIESFACANLVSKMEAGLLDPAPVWTNLKTFPWESFRGKVDILSGGYPCQPFSSAGKRLGKEDPRHLWPYIADGIRILQPALCFFENVEGHITLGLRDVLQELGELGYRSAWGIFSAEEVGAPHQRKRVFVVAHNHRNGGAGSGDELGVLGALGQGRKDTEAHRVSIPWPSRPREQQWAWEPPRVVGDAQHAGSQGQWHNATPEHRADSGLQFGAANGNDFDARQTESTLGGGSDGPPDWMGKAKLYTSCDNRTDELRLLGNGVVPATATRAFLTLIKEL